jgi:hypothetical protein
MANRKGPSNRPVAMLVAFLVIVGCWMLWTGHVQTNHYYFSVERRQFFEQEKTDDTAASKNTKTLFPRDCWLNPPWGDNKSLQDDRNNVSQRVCAVRGGESAERDLVSPYTTAQTLTCPDTSAFSSSSFITNHGTNQTKTSHNNNNTTTTTTADVVNNGTKNKISIVLLYYANPRGLLLHLEHIMTSYSSQQLQQEIEVLWIIDDGSPPGLRANEYLGLVAAASFNNNNNNNTIPFPIRLARVTENIAWNMPGTQNLGLYLVPDHSHVLLLDLDTMISTNVFRRLVYLANNNNNNKTQNNNDTDTSTSKQQQQQRDHVAYRFNGVESGIQHPKIMFLRKETYWHVGGYEEDFVPHYGHDDYAFWYRFRLCGDACHIVESNELVIYQRGHDPKSNNGDKNGNRTFGACDIDDWLDDDDAVAAISGDGTNNQQQQRYEKCLDALRSLPNPPKRDDIPTNKKLFQRRKFTQCWSNHYLRFPWVEEGF